MKSIVSLLCIFPILSFSQEYSENVLTAQQIMDIVEEHLVHVEKIDLSRYTLRSVSFDYLQSQTGNEWMVFYEGKPNTDGTVPLGHHFGVRLTNTKEPKIEFIPGI